MRAYATFRLQLRRLAWICLTLPALSCAKMEAPAPAGAAPAASATYEVAAEPSPESAAAPDDQMAVAEERKPMDSKPAPTSGVHPSTIASGRLRKDGWAMHDGEAPGSARPLSPRAPRLDAPRKTERIFGSDGGKGGGKGGGDVGGKAGNAAGGFAFQGSGEGGGGTAATVRSVAKPSAHDGSGSAWGGEGKLGLTVRQDAMLELAKEKADKKDEAKGKAKDTNTDAADRDGAADVVTRKAVVGAFADQAAATRLFGGAREAEEGEKQQAAKAEDRQVEVDEATRQAAARAFAPPPPPAEPSVVEQDETPLTSDACSEWPAEAEPMPRRCHLAPTYHAGRASWQRRLQTLAGLPRELAAADWAGRGSPTIDAPDKTALAVDARLDRDAIDGPGRVWMRVWLRSTEGWGMRRPPFDLAVILGPNARQQHAAETCASLQALVADVGAQDRFSLIWGDAVDPRWDGISGIDAAARVNALCAEGLGARTGEALLADQHEVARRLLASHASAEHRVAGTRVVVALAAGDESRLGLHESVSAGVEEPTLTSLLLVGGGEADAAWWDLADSGHGAIEAATPGRPERAAKAIWQTWGRVVARLVRVDIQLAPGVVARRVVGSRALDAHETLAVRRREQAVDANLARVAGVASDRNDDGVGMTMLIPAFLGSDEHAIDIELEVHGAGAVADVVVDYKDLVRMTNAKATTRAALDRLPPAISRAVAGPDPRIADTLPTLRRLRTIAASARSEALERAFLAALPQSMATGTLALWQTAASEAAASAPARVRLVALMDTWLATVGGCHVASRR